MRGVDPGQAATSRSIADTLRAGARREPAARAGTLDAVHPAAASVATTLGQLGAAAVVAAIVGGLIAARAAGRRERETARRAWLGEALERFYGPVSAKLEMYYEWNRRLWEEGEAKRDEKGELLQTELDMTVIRKAVRANIKVHDDIRAIVEASLHYVDEPELRKEALAFLADRYIDDWRRDAGGLDKLIAENRGWVIVTEPERTRFMTLVADRFEAKASEFRKLSGGASPP